MKVSELKRFLKGLPDEGIIVINKNFTAEVLTARWEVLDPMAVKVEYIPFDVSGD